MRTLILLALTVCPALAGIVYEIEVKDHDQSPPATESIEAAVEGRNLKMGIASGYRGTGNHVTVIFMGKRVVINVGTMRVIDGQKKEYATYPKGGVKSSRRATPKKTRTVVKEGPQRVGDTDYIVYAVKVGGVVVRRYWAVVPKRDAAEFEMRKAMAKLAEFFPAAAIADTVYADLAHLGGHAPKIWKDFDAAGKATRTTSVKNLRKAKVDAAAEWTPTGFRAATPGR